MRWLLLLLVCGRTTRPVRAPGLCCTAVRVGLVMLELVVVVAVVVVVLSWWCDVVLFAFGCGDPAVGSLLIRMHTLLQASRMVLARVYLLLGDFIET